MRVRLLALLLLVLSGSAQAALTFDTVTTMNLNSGNNNDLLSQASLTWLIPASNDGSVVTGVSRAGFAYGDIIWIVNLSSAHTFVVSHQNASSSLANRFTMVDGLSKTIQPGRSIAFVLDQIYGWQALGGSAEAGPTGAQGIQGATGSQGTAGTNGTNGTTGATGSTGAQGPAGVGLGTLTVQQPGVTGGTSNRVIGTAFQPSVTNPVFACYRASTSITASLAGSNQGRIRIRVGASSTTTTEFPGTVELTYNLGLGLAVANTITNSGSLCAFVGAGQFVLIDTVTTTGTVTFSLPTNAAISGAQVEQLLN